MFVGIATVVLIFAQCDGAWGANRGGHTFAILMYTSYAVLFWKILQDKVMISANLADGTAAKERRRAEKKRKE